MRCGNCGMSAATVEVVKACYEGQPHSTFSPDSDHEPLDPASDGQINYVLGLQDERVLPDNWTIYTEDMLRKMERADVSGAISVLKALPRGHKNDTTATKHDMPEGRYALQVDGTWRFYKVDMPTEGRWAGYTFVNRLIARGGGDYNKEPVRNRHERETILKRIEHDPKQAMADYGFQSGHCGSCGRALSNEESLALGIGPICAGKMGW